MKVVSLVRLDEKINILIEKRIQRITRRSIEGDCIAKLSRTRKIAIFVHNELIKAVQVVRFNDIFKPTGMSQQKNSPLC